MEYADQLVLDDDEVALAGGDINLVPAVALAMADDEVPLSAGGEYVVAAAVVDTFSPPFRNASSPISPILSFLTPADLKPLLKICW